MVPDLAIIFAPTRKRPDTVRSTACFQLVATAQELQWQRQSMMNTFHGDAAKPNQQQIPNNPAPNEPSFLPPSSIPKGTFETSSTRAKTFRPSRRPQLPDPAESLGLVIFHHRHGLHQIRPPRPMPQHYYFLTQILLGATTLTLFVPVCYRPRPDPGPRSLYAPNSHGNTLLARPSRVRSTRLRPP